MSRGKSSGGGQSSLGYLFGSKIEGKEPPPPPSPPVCTPPYGIDTMAELPQQPKPQPPPTKEDQRHNYIYHRVDGHNSENFLTGRPSAKINSVPGGDSSLGYLFGDK